MLLVDFNSIKVRLRLRSKIETSRVILFQFHKGSIKTKMGDRSAGGIWNFNSIKVRLRLSVNLTLRDLSLFQFHKGSIKTG